MELIERQTFYGTNKAANFTEIFTKATLAHIKAHGKIPNIIESYTIVKIV